MKTHKAPENEKNAWRERGYKDCPDKKKESERQRMCHSAMFGSGFSRLDSISRRQNYSVHRKPNLIFHGLRCKNTSFLIGMQILHAPLELWDVEKAVFGVCRASLQGFGKIVERFAIRSKIFQRSQCDGIIDRSGISSGTTC